MNDLDLNEADKILKEYSEPNPLIDEGNLFFAAIEYKKGYQQLMAVAQELRDCLRCESEHVENRLALKKFKDLMEAHVGGSSV